MDADPIEFAQRLADPTRLNYVAIDREKGDGDHKRLAEEAQRRRAERVMPIMRGKKKEMPPARIELAHAV